MRACWRQAEGRAVPDIFKVASYNIHKGVGTDRRRDPARILGVLNEVDADIVCLQEADLRFGTREAVLPRFLIESHTDYIPVPLDVQHDSMGWHGNAILVRQGIKVESHDIIHIPCLEPRGVVTARVRIGEVGLSVFGMHLDLSGLWRARQAKTIAALGDAARGAGPTVLMGDLNEWRASAGCFREFGRHFALLDPGPSFPSRRPLGRLDRILHCDRLRVTDCGVHRSAAATIASDHLPVWAQFMLA
ncbi:endonuclease/exonuclease/phosphatase family protein [Porphyrobacter sp. YT40]|uniref:endonuclease/exonuclease/phosphatase family protein n=1 Tax=Porphyrobacter sp. YT40 TaxID=2547601 RepID=UPI001141BF04|nr:endonuclease/exonuclease/phosphatase family protein [Porphyrobacter sp. YT40]QDH33814.1 endonuclease [Porphyrobacter sp. YT40]